MGGLGSGGHNRKSFGTVEHALSIDASRFKQRGLLTRGWSGRWVWNFEDGAQRSIGVSGGVDAVRLSFRRRGGDGNWQEACQRINIAYCDRRMGGHEAYFMCAPCGRRVRYLYLAGARFRCRTCSTLRHASARESVQERACRKVRTLRRRMGADVAFEAPVPRRKCMHQKTWERSVDAIIEAEAAAMEPLLSQLQRIQRRVKSPKKTAQSKCEFWS